ncbi:hypothetical protein OAU08_02505 [Porticoccaceae bacterium]|nr:hypothetical protein [Porticoccaceae bacterium]
MTFSMKSTNNLDFDLFHGSSSIFLNSIYENGLGYRDNEIFDKEVFEKLKAALFSFKGVSKYWQEMEYFLECISEGQGRFNYEGVYFTPSRNNALRYAENNYGSEYLSTIHGMYQDLKLHDLAAAEIIINSNSKLANIFRQVHRPILVIYRNAAVSDLWVEKGKTEEDVFAQLTEMDSTFQNLKECSGIPEERIKEIAWQQDTFICKRILSVDEILIET